MKLYINEKHNQFIGRGAVGVEIGRIEDNILLERVSGKFRGPRYNGNRVWVKDKDVRELTKGESDGTKTVT